MMSDGGKERVMAKEVSALNTYWLVEYIEQHYPEVDMSGIVSQALAGGPDSVENLYTGEVERVTLEHLRLPRYWFANSFIKTLHDLIEVQIPDPRLAYKIGRDMYKTQPLLKTTIGMSLLGVHGVARRVSREAARFNRTKKYIVKRLAKGVIELRIVHGPGIVGSRFTMLWNAGCFASYARLAGATEVDVDVLCVESGPKNPDDPGRAIWDFVIKYQEPRVLVRIGRGALRLLPWVRRLTEQADEIQDDHVQQILERDNIISERTEQLLSIQQKHIEEEREVIGQKLQKISMELVTAEERERRAIAEDLHDSVTQMLALSLRKVRSFLEVHTPRY